jgi:voltage-gated potassium channel
MNKLQAATDTVKELAVWYVSLLVITATVFAAAEGACFADALYWAATTATSTGYGDMSPKTWAGKVDAVVLMHLSIFVIAPMVIVRLIDRLTVDPNTFSHDEQATLLADVAAIRVMLEKEGK